MTPIVVAKEVTNDVLASAKDWLELLRDSTPLANDEEQEGAAEWIRSVKTMHRHLETKRKEITDPMNQALRAVNDLFRPARETLEQVEKCLKLKIAEYLELQHQANAEALEAAAESETSEEATEALAMLTTAEAPKGVSVRYVWRVEVVDPLAVPHWFTSPDIGKLQEYAKGKEDPQVAGVLFHKEPIVTSRQVK